MKKLLSSLILSSILIMSACSSNSTETSSAAAMESVTSVETKASESTTFVESSNEETLATKVKIASLKGPTSMGMVKLMEDKSADYTFSILNSPDEVSAGLISKEYDLATVPANLASVLHNKTQGQVKVLAINTLGVLYIVEKGSSDIKTIEDLKGKTIYASGQGATPEYILSYLLSEHGLNIESDVTVEWKFEHTEVISNMSQSEQAVALLPQPFVTVAQTQIEGLNTSLDLTKEWDALGKSSRLITGVLVAQTEFIEQHEQALDAILEEYKSSIEWVNANVDEAAALIEKYDIVKAPVAKKALPFCNITYIDGEEMRTALAGYLEVLSGLKMEAVGGKLPEAEFYYIQQ